jgi:hypothetical protein
VRCGKGRKEENEIKDYSKIVEPLRASLGPHLDLKKAPSGP